MRSTVDMDDKLYEEAVKLTAVKSKKELINMSLREIIRKKRREHLLSLYGTSPIEISPADVEKFREDGSR